MNTNNNSMTEGLTVVVKFQGMVSLSRIGKSVDFKRTKQNGNYGCPKQESGFSAIYGSPTKCNIPNENLNIVSDVKSADQILHITQQTLNHWVYEPCSLSELRNTGKKWLELTEEQRIFCHINDMVHDLSCSSSWGSQPLKASWYIQTLQPVFELTKQITEVKTQKTTKVPVAKQEQETIDLRFKAPEQILVPGTFTRDGNPVFLNVLGYVDLSKFNKKNT